MNTDWFRTLSYVAWLMLASCSDEVAVIGHFHAMRDASSGTPGDAGDGATELDAAASGMAGPLAGSGAAPVDATRSGDTLALEPGTRAQFCAGSGSALRVVSAASARPTCTPGIGRRLFRYGVCACGDVSATQSLSTFTLDAFDSRNGPFDKAESGAALGIDGALHVGNVAVAVSG